MEESDQRNDNSSRIKSLEAFRIELEKKLYATKIVATFLGIGAVLGGTWITVLTNNLGELSERIEDVEERVTESKHDIEKAAERVSELQKSMETSLVEEQERLLERLHSESDQIVSRHKERLQEVVTEKTAEITDIGSDDLLEKLEDGSMILVARALRLTNQSGRVTVDIGTDSGGDGYIRINSDKGSPRYIMSLSNDRPHGQYYNTENNRVLSVGAYSDQNIGFVRFRDEQDETTLLELSSDTKGGKVNAYSTSGKQIIYIGPEGNTGSGLVNVMSVQGESAASYGPRK